MMTLREKAFDCHTSKQFLKCLFRAAEAHTIIMSVICIQCSETCRLSITAFKAMLWPTI